MSTLAFVCCDMYSASEFLVYFFGWNLIYYYFLLLLKLVLISTCGMYMPHNVDYYSFIPARILYLAYIIKDFPKGSHIII